MYIQSAVLLFNLNGKTIQGNRIQLLKYMQTSIQISRKSYTHENLNFPYDKSSRVIRGELYLLIFDMLN